MDQNSFQIKNGIENYVAPFDWSIFRLLFSKSSVNPDSTVNKIS